VIKLDKNQVKFIKKNLLTEEQRKSRVIKQFEQTGGNVTFKGLDGNLYTLRYTATGAYTNYIEFGEHYNTGFMHKGNNVRSMDKHHKFNHTEYKLHKQIDKK
tara:strand:- start:5396 stop:5701 length:306 start_codon:yes stop_codon:yes gene_type:complete